ncbi:sensor domain-containing protein [Salinisphaera sp.]|uniref:sensor domain-containing protein n=1 Tax=Salinisphaera sp. TaxID=1914330 RepID=UPI002D7658BF|nr:EAL domain-containing protein [Salinisphaera sp.]HET7315414.1 EAL domain-containing protein [Salinisphaera sp.]
MSTTDCQAAIHRQLLDGLTEHAIYMLDAEGRIRSWSAGAQRLTGYGEQEALGTLAWQFDDPESADNGPDAILAAAREHGRHETQIQRRRKDGSRFSTHGVVEAVSDRGRITGFAVIERECGKTRGDDGSAGLADRQFRLLFESVTLYAILMLDLEGVVTSCNPAGVEAIKGYAADEIVGRHFSIFQSRADCARGLPEAAIARARDEGRHQVEGWRYRKNGTPFWAGVLMIPIREAGQLIGFANITRDMTRHKQHENDILQAKRIAEHRYRESRSLSAFLNNVIGNIPIRVVVADSQTGQILIDNAGQANDGCAAAIDAGIIIERLRGPAAKTLADAETRETRIAVDTAEGAMRLKCRVLRVTDDIGGGYNLMYLVEDVTEEHRASEKIHFMAHHDALTHLPNRTLFNKRLDQALTAGDYEHTAVGLLLIDLDNFKNINDVLGHPVGDRLLIQVAARLRSALDDAAMLARIGGDEFCVVIPQCGDAAGLERVARRLIETMRDPVVVDDHAVQSGVSIGLVVSDADIANTEDLLRCADLALYDAKRGGRGTYSVFHPGLHRAARMRLDLEVDLRRGFEADEFVLYYQPIMASDSLTVSGMEALLRWRHPERGIVPPLEFIPMAEETGLIRAIGARVLMRACCEAAGWSGEASIAVNLSPVQFDDRALVDHVRDALATSGLAPHRLELEITESILLDASRNNIHLLEALKAMGVKIVLDDFGTGYSSLHYLRSFAFDRIKIDKSFVKEVCHDAEAQAIVKAITSLGESLCIQITAEGVEHIEQANQLRADGCSHLQGYYFGRPESAAAAALTAPSQRLGRARRAGRSGY